MDRSEAPEVYICYSSADQNRAEELLDHLQPAMESRHFDCWSHEKIPPGKIWRNEIETAIASAKVAVLLVSREFFATDLVMEIELPLLLEAARREDLTLLWLPESPSNYEATEIADFQPIHPPDEPLDGLGQSDRQQALVEISRKIVAVLEERRSPANGAGQNLRLKARRGTPANGGGQLQTGTVRYLKIAIVTVAVVGLVFWIARTAELWGPPEPPPPPPENRMIKFDVRDTPLQEIFKEVARQIGARPVVDPTITGSYSLSVDGEAKDFMNEICYEVGKCTWKIQPGEKPALVVLPPKAVPLKKGGE